MKEEQKGDMQGNKKHEFFVVNISSKALKGTVSWHNSDYSEAIDVNGLQPASISKTQAFTPASRNNDYWHWSEKGRDYQLNCYGDDRYAVVVISDYGIGVLVTNTSPDTWSW
jgi:hypothetical protein